MAVALTYVEDLSLGNKRGRTFDLAFSGNYATNGETITAAAVGLTKIDRVDMDGQVSAASTPTTAVSLGSAIATDGVSTAIRAYESGAANAPLAEKGNAEAYITGQTVRATFVGW